MVNDFEIVTGRIDVFLDTNILIGLFDNLENFDNLHRFSKVHFCTFEKCVYEYFIKYKKLLWDKNFLIDCLNNKIFEDKIRLKMKNIVLVAANSKYYTKESLITAIKNKSDIKGRKQFFYAITKEKVYQEDEEYINLYDRFCNSNLLEDDSWFLFLFYKSINYQLSNIRSKIYDTVNVFLYEQVFTPINTIEFFRDIISNSTINSNDLEIITACIANFCNLFLTSDKDLLLEIVTIGVSSSTKFMYINPNSNVPLVEQIEKTLTDYMNEYNIGI